MHLILTVPFFINFDVNQPHVVVQLKLDPILKYYTTD